MKSDDFRRGVRASIAWLHAEALTMNDPHAKSILNNAAFHLGCDKPTLTTEEAAQVSALKAENERLRAALEPFAGLGMFLSGDDAYVEFQRWDFKLTVGDFRRARAALAEPVPAEWVLACGCYQCTRVRYLNEPPSPDDAAIPGVDLLRMSRMFLCPTCGNKRCPGAADHRFRCTGSNEPGQRGSRYEDAAAPPPPTQVEQAGATQGPPAGPTREEVADIIDPEATVGNGEWDRALAKADQIIGMFGREK